MELISLYRSCWTPGFEGEMPCYSSHICHDRLRNSCDIGSRYGDVNQLARLDFLPKGPHRARQARRPRQCPPSSVGSRRRPASVGRIEFELGNRWKSGEPPLYSLVLDHLRVTSELFWSSTACRLLGGLWRTLREAACI